MSDETKKKAAAKKAVVKKKATKKAKKPAPEAERCPCGKPFKKPVLLKGSGGKRVCAECVANYRAGKHPF